jgi:integrase/recombinase XerD
MQSTIGFESRSATVPKARRPSETKELQFNDWPHHHRELFQATFQRSTDPFDEQGPGGHLKPKTIKGLCQAVARFLGHLRDCKVSMLHLAIKESLTREDFQSFCQALEKTNSSVSTASILGKLYMAVRYMAPHHDWDWLRIFARRFERSAMPRRRPAIPFTSDRLVDMGLSLMQEADSLSAGESAARHLPRLRTAVLYRDGLLLCLEALLPLRVSNLALLELGKTVRKIGGKYWILIEGDDTKNTDPIEAALPDWLSGHIEHFIASYRPAFARTRRSSVLFPSTKHDRLTEAGLADAFKKRIRQSTGVNTSIHNARRIAATTIAIADPANVSVASDLLGHRSKRVTERHYNLASGIEASRVLAEEIRRFKRPK